ncbi:hypothetical protein H671_1g2554 [Cricetulus griseus]|uniref:Uncharacterized protein n=1 Tax=Cricetulus griseus TaxID=10029 RepID=A0A061IK45_CRIGR|nr:hypothetical protein H671_1g2554 [Cricetulus griseus]
MVENVFSAAAMAVIDVPCSRHVPLLCCQLFVWKIMLWRKVRASYSIGIYITSAQCLHKEEKRREEKRRGEERREEKRREEKRREEKRREEKRREDGL